MTVADKSINRAAVRRGLGAGKKPPDFVATVAATCATGASCQEVTSTTVGAAALAALQKALGTSQTALSSKQAALLVLLTTAKALLLELAGLRSALSSYESVVGTIAAGNAAIINKAGLLSRDQKAPTAALGVVEDVTSKPGKALTEAILRWPAVAGATGYAIQVNYTPATPTGPWTAITSGSRRRRVVKAPTAGGQFLAQVAAISSDGVQSAWSASILVTAR
jgi:hypothetical protein